MNRVRIGSIVPGDNVEKFLPEFLKYGYECVSFNFHMVFPEKDLATFAQRVKAAAGGAPVEVSSIGYYCNALENEEQRHTLEHFIDNAKLFGTNLVTTYGGHLAPGYL